MTRCVQKSGRVSKTWSHPEQSLHASSCRHGILSIQTPASLQSFHADQASLSLCLCCPYAPPTSASDQAGHDLPSEPIDDAVCRADKLHLGPEPVEASRSLEAGQHSLEQSQNQYKNQLYVRPGHELAVSGDVDPATDNVILESRASGGFREPRGRTVQP